MTSKAFRIAVLLPVRERYARQGAGAVASVVDGLARYSGQRKSLSVLGTKVDFPLEGAAFLPVCPAPWWRGLKTRRYLLGAARRLKGNIDLLEIHNRPKYIPLLRKKLPGIALVLYLHNDPRTMEGMKTVQGRRNLATQVEGVICVSDYIRRCFLDGLDDLAAKTFVVRNAVDTEMFCPLPEQEKRKEIIFVGRTIEDKGPHLLAAAAERILPDYPEWKIVIVGGRYFGEGRAEAYEKDLFERVRRLGPQGEVTGYLPRHEVLLRWQRAAIAVLPSLWEDPISLVALEAAACGCAVITTRRGGISEGIGRGALYLEKETPAAVESHLHLLMNDPVALKDWQRKAREQAVQYCDLRAAAQSLDKARTTIMIDAPTVAQASMPA